MAKPVLYVICKPLELKSTAVKSNPASPILAYSGIIAFGCNFFIFIFIMSPFLSTYKLLQIIV